MFTKLFAFIIILVLVYILSIFIIPELADQYGNKNLNVNIRNIKDKSLNFASGSDSVSSIADKLLNVSHWIVESTKEKLASGSEIKNVVIDSGKIFIQEWKQTLENTEKIISEKTEQAKQTVDSITNAYEAIDQAKKNIQNFTNFSWVTLTPAIQ